MAEPMLFTPITVRGLEVRNRLWVAPMCQYSVDAEDGVAGEWHRQHIGSLARGGAGAVMVEATAVVPEGRISPNDLGIWNDEQAAALAHLVQAGTMHGARMGIQLAHAGRKASTHGWLPGRPTGSIATDDGGWQTVAPSAIEFPGLQAPAALSRTEIDRIITAFTAGARRAVASGFDLVEVHAAHGYLLHEFLSPLSNLRDDEYGGGLENRARLLLDVVSAIRERFPDLPVVVRISATDWTDGGFTADEATRVAHWLAGVGADLIDVSSGGNSSGASIPVGPSYQVPLAQAIGTGPLPVGAVGQITSADQAESILVTGQADIVSLGRPLLANPHLPLAWARELGADTTALTPPQYWRARF